MLNIGQLSHIYLPILNVRGRSNPVSICGSVHCLKEADIYLSLRKQFIIEMCLEIVSWSALSKFSQLIQEETRVRQL